MRTLAIALAVLLTTASSIKAQGDTALVGGVTPETLRDSIETLGKRFTALSAQIDQLQRDVEDARLAPPQGFQEVSVRRTGDRARIAFAFSVIGRALVKITGENGFRDSILSDTLSKKHAVMFIGLPPKKKFKAEVVVLQNTNAMARTAVIAQSHTPANAHFFPQLAFETAEASTDPVLYDVTHVAGSRGVSVEFRSNTPVAARVEVYSKRGGTIDETTVVASGGASLAADDMGIPADPVSLGETLRVNGLAPSTEYAYRVKGFSSGGKSDVSSLVTFRTSPVPALLASPVAIRIDPLGGLIVAWRASMKPDSAGIVASFRSTTIRADSVPTSDSVQVRLDPSKVLAAALADGEVPVISVWMAGSEGSRWQQQFTLGIVKPQIDPDVARRIAAAAGGEGAGEATKKLLEAMQQPTERKHFKWEHWVQTGLKLIPVVVSAIP